MSVNEDGRQRSLKDLFMRLSEQTVGSQESINSFEWLVVHLPFGRAVNYG